MDETDRKRIVSQPQLAIRAPKLSWGFFAIYGNTDSTTVYRQPRLALAEEGNDFRRFLENQPSGKIAQRSVFLGCNVTVAAGLYIFVFGKLGTIVKARYTYACERWQWSINSHQALALPQQ